MQARHSGWQPIVYGEVKVPWVTRARAGLFHFNEGMSIGNVIREMKEFKDIECPKYKGKDVVLIDF